MPDLAKVFPGARFASRMDDPAAFTEGWAQVPFAGDKPHWYREITATERLLYPDAPADIRWFRSLCGHEAVTNERNGVMSPGNFPLCKRCLKKAPRWATKEERSTETTDEIVQLFRKP